MSYNPNIKAGDPALRSNKENWVASTRNQSRKPTIDRGANNYPLKLVNPTWLRPLNKDTIFFTRLKPIEMHAKLTKASGGLERVDTINLLVSLTQLWEQDPHVPDYLNRLRDGQKKANCVGLPFSDDLLSAITSSLLLKANSFPKDHPKWDGKIPEYQTLKTW